MTLPSLNEEEEQTQTKNVGTSYFRAPEAINGRYSAQTDMYMLGKSMKWLKEMRKNKMFKSQSSELSDWEKVENLCIRSKPNDRISASEVKSILLANSNIDMKGVAKKCQKQPKSSQNGQNPPKIPDLVKSTSGVNAITNDMDALKVEETDTKKCQKQPKSSQNGQNDKDIEQKEIVYLAATARTRNSPKGKTGMKYHEKKGCFKANSHIAIEEAESFGHSPCRKCLKPLQIF